MAGIGQVRMEGIRVAAVVMKDEMATHGNIWRATLPSVNASFKAYTIVAESSLNDTVHIDDVLVGDVWVCSGQVHMNPTQCKHAAL